MDPLMTVLQWFIYSCMAYSPLTTGTPDLNMESSSSSNIILNSSGNATLDTPIWFTATYTDFQEGDDLECQWYDDTWNYHTESMVTGATNWSLVYDRSHYQDYTGIRVVTLKVKKWTYVTYITIAWASLQFRLSGYLTGDLLITQVNVSIPAPGYISTANQTNLTALVNDPNDWMKKRTIFATFYWVINHSIIATCDTPSLLINISDPQDYQIQANIYLYLSNEIITTTPVPTTIITTATTQLTTTSNQTITTPKATAPRSDSTTQPSTSTSPITPVVTTANPPLPNNHTWQCSGWWPSNRRGAYEGAGNYGPNDIKFSKFGTFSNSTKAREPIGTLNVTGSQWLKRGQLTNLTVQCSGSGSWTYCSTILPGSYNVTGKETCKEPLVTTVCDFELIHLFKRNGTFSYLIIITNEVSTQIETVPIKIYNVDRQPQLSYIIVPVSCSLVVIIIIIFGSAYLQQSRQRYLVEVADFDFEVSEDIMYNKTMCEQLREAFAEALFTNTDELEDDDTQWREGSRIVETPTFLESGTRYGTIHS